MEHTLNTDCELCYDLRNMRSAMKMTMTDVAATSGVSLSSIKRWEKAEFDYNPERWFAYVQALSPEGMIAEVNADAGRRSLIQGCAGVVAALGAGLRAASPMAAATFGMPLVSWWMRHDKVKGRAGDWLELVNGDREELRFSLVTSRPNTELFAFSNPGELYEMSVRSLGAGFAETRALMIDDGIDHEAHGRFLF